MKWYYRVKLVVSNRKPLESKTKTFGFWTDSLLDKESCMQERIEVIFTHGKKTVNH